MVFFCLFVSCFWVHNSLLALCLGSLWTELNNVNVNNVNRLALPKIIRNCVQKRNKAMENKNKCFGEWRIG